MLFRSTETCPSVVAARVCGIRLIATTLGQVSVGQRVNLEVDPLARYAERVVSLMSGPVGGKTT